MGLYQKFPCLDAVDAGDKIKITFSEQVYGNEHELVDDFTLNSASGNFSFESDDIFSVDNNVVTVTLGNTTLAALEGNITIIMTSNASDVSLTLTLSNCHIRIQNKISSPNQ
ncbi:hypothetical protein [Brevibacillus sp. SIMBA_040]|uniref:hypothetical protein n=1 Tax=unclassified Brevibacillus TaxID=2684853 RepID=UPI00397B952D